METSDFALAPSYVRHIAEQLRTMGVDVDAWLARRGVREADFDSVALSYDAFASLVLDALVVSDEPALGLFVGERLVATTHGIVGHAAANSATIREAVHVLERFTALRTSLVAIVCEERPAGVHIRFDEVVPLGPIRRPVMEAVMLSVKNVVHALARAPGAVTAVTFPFEAPDHASLAAEMFGCDVTYGVPTATLALAPALLAVPLVFADRDAFREAAQLCQRQLDKLASKALLSARVRRLLAERQNGFPSLPAMARQLRLGPRTFHRRLAEEGTSYRALLEQVRHALAVEHLRAGRSSVDEIAFVLGYTDTANFRRAFRRWEAVPPSVFAARHRAPR